MKNNLLLLMTFGLALSFCKLAAQPTLTATGINSTLGESFTLKGNSYASPGNAGANQTWNLSSITGASGGLTNVVMPSTTTYASSFTNANIAWSNSTSGVFNYYKTSSTVMQNYGYYGGGVVFSYSDPEDFMRFPFTYNNTYTDAWSVTFVNAGTTYYRTGTSTFTADGYGTLTTPAKTYNNVTRVHMVQEYQDSADVGGFPFIITYTNDQYFWYVNGAHVPVALVFTLTSSTGGPYTGGNYLQSASTEVEGKQAVPAISALVYPSPATDLINIELEMTENQKTEVKLFNSFGQQVAIMQVLEGGKGLSTLQMDVADLPAGVYFAQVSSESIISEMKRFVLVR